MSGVTSLVPIIENHRLDVAKQRIAAAHVRTSSDWLEGSVDMAVALAEARRLIPPTVTFHGWLIAHGLDFHNKDDRNALLQMGENIELLRAVLTETTSRSYDIIWREHRLRFRPSTKTKPRRTRGSRGSPMTYRAMKLGEAAMAKIKDTSLDSAAEMDELIMLNRGSTPGELSDLVRQLIDAAAAGKNVSALAESTKLCNGRRSKVTRRLIESWRKRMVSAWTLADDKEQLTLLVHLVHDSKWDNLDDLLTALIEESHNKSKGA